jgi:hypothetical protein
VKPRLRKAKEPLEDALAALKETAQRIARDDRDARKGSPVEQFIADKKFMETLVKSKPAPTQKSRSSSRGCWRSGRASSTGTCGR